MNNKQNSMKSIRSQTVENNKTLGDVNKSKDQKQALIKFSKPSKYIFRSEGVQRVWLEKHGKKKFIDFNDEERKQFRKYFASLDNDGSGDIGVDELEDPLIALGLANTRDDVMKLVNIVDSDGSGQIEFNEFLAIMTFIKKNSNGENIQASMFKLFSEMLNGNLMEDMDPNVPFRLNVSQFRRKRILDAIWALNQEKKENGQKILIAFKRQRYAQKQKEKMLRGEDPNDVSLDQIPNKDDGANTRNGFPKLPKIMQKNAPVLVKPKSLGIQSTYNKN